MSAYEELLDVMRTAGKYHNPPPLELGTMKTDGKIQLADLELDKEDYLLDCNLRLDESKKIFLHKEEPKSGGYLTDAAHNSTLKEYKRNLLQEGDQVVLFKTSIQAAGEEIEQYIVIAKVVEPT